MKGKKSSRVSIREVALAAGVSKGAASFALKNRPGVSNATRERILRIAKDLGYVPDARIASMMASVQNAKSKDLLPIAWLNANEQKDVWRKYKFMLPYLEGAQERALQLGYRLEELWLHEPGISLARFNRILYQRGIQAVIVTPPARHLRLDWNRLAGVAIGGEFLSPRLDAVFGDSTYNLQLSLKILRRYGYRRIGIYLSEYYDRASSHNVRATAYYFNFRNPQGEKVPPLFYPGEGDRHSRVTKRKFAAWFSRYKPEAIICHTNQMVNWVEEVGFRVPNDVGIAHLATDDDVDDWAGITSNRRAIGAVAADMAVSLINSRQLGVPRFARETLIRGSWHFGRTLLIPKPK